MEGPEISVIVAAHRPTSLLNRSIERLATAGSVRLELLLVVSGGDPAALLATWPGLQAQLVDGQGTSLSEARNRGIVASRAPLVAFLDDDAVPSPDWAQAIVRAFQDPAVEAVCGRTLPLWGGPRPDWLDDWLLRRVSAALGLFDRGPHDARACFPKYGVGANMAFRRGVFQRVGVFSGRLGRQSGKLLSNEEIELLRRVEVQGGRVMYAANAEVAHLVPPDRLQPSYLARRAFWQGVSEAHGGGFGLGARVLLLAGRLGRLGLAMGWLVVRWRRSSLVFLRAAAAAVLGFASAILRLEARAERWVA